MKRPRTDVPREKSPPPARRSQLRFHEWWSQITIRSAGQPPVAYAEIRRSRHRLCSYTKRPDDLTAIPRACAVVYAQAHADRDAGHLSTASVAAPLGLSRRRLLLPLALAQFICSFAGSNMNVMITDITEDLDTTVQGVQTAITVFLLVMAALMIPAAS